MSNQANPLLRPGDREWLQRAAAAAHQECPDGTCFILMVAQQGSNNGRMLRYAGNMDLETALNVTREFVTRIEKGGNFGNHQN